MSQNEPQVESVAVDPIEALNATKEKIQKEIATIKISRTQATKDLRRAEKLNIEDVPDKQERVVKCLEELEKLNNQLVEKEIDLKNLNRTRDDENEESIQAALHTVSESYINKNPSAAYIIDQQQFMYIKEYSNAIEKQNVLMKEMEPAKFVEILANDLGLCAWHLPVHRLKNLFNAEKRTFELSRYTLDNTRWGDSKVYLPLDHLREHFIDRVVLSDEEYQQIKDSGVIDHFNCLMYSLSGGKEENKNHIEQWILHKIVNYKKATTTPDLVIVGHVGGNGKGILQAIIRAMMPATLSGKANAKTLKGDFNAILLGKLVVFFDDQDSKEIPLAVVKQLAGADTMIIEQKGRDQFEGEKTHSSAWFSNVLPFKLTPAGQEGGVDRRFSVTRTNITFLESLRKYYSEQRRQTVTIEESKDLAEYIVTEHLLNRRNMAAWYRYMHEAHPEVDYNFTLKALHGEDYKYFLKEQEQAIDIVFRDLIKPAIEIGGCVPIFVVKELARHIGGYVPHENKIAKIVKDLAQKNKLAVEIDRRQIEITSGFQGCERKQCVVIRPRELKDWSEKEFKWDAISSKPYKGSVPKGEELIHEDDLKFGVKGDVDDDTNLFDISSNTDID